MKRLKKKLAAIVPSSLALNKSNKRAAIKLFCVAVAATLLLIVSRVFSLILAPMSFYYYGIYGEITYYLIIAVIFAAFVIGATVYLQRTENIHIMEIQRERLPIKNASLALTLLAVTLFVMCASMGFKFKLEYEMGVGITSGRVLMNVGVHFYYGLHLWMGFIIMHTTQRACDLLIKDKCVPFGYIAFIVLYGLPELLLETFATGMFYSPHDTYAYVYFILLFSYGGVYYLTQKSFHSSYWACFLVNFL